MNTEYRDKICHYIIRILNYAKPILWSWGPEEYYNIEYNNMPALKFKVNGFLHKDDVVIAYNEGLDCFEIYCLDKSGKVVKSRDNIYLDELVETIDCLVEKDCSLEEYYDQVRESFHKFF